MGNIKDLPERWEYTKVSKIATLIRGINYKKEQASNYPSQSTSPILRANNINGELNYDDLVYVPKELIKPEQIIKKNDIIFAMSSGSKHLVGKTAVSKKDFNGSCGAFCALLRINNDVDKNFISYIFKGNTYRKLISEIANGTNINNLKREHILGFEFPLPPLKTQQEIVSKIEELFSELDKGIAELKLAQEQLKVYRQSVLKYAFEGRLTNEYVKDGELPEGWQINDLKNVIEKPKYGTSKKCDYNTVGKGVLRIPNIVKGVVDSSDLKFAEFDEKEIETYQLKKDDLLIIRSNGSVDIVGKCAIVSSKEENFLYAGYLIRLRPLEGKILGKYLLYALNSIELRKQIENKAKSTSGVNNINSEEISTLQISLAPFSEQNLIVQEIENRLSVADKMEESITESLQKAEALRQSILKKAFSGELVTEIKAIEVPKIKNEYFHQLQLVALVINGFKNKKIDHGEMTLAKNLYLLDSIYKIPTGFNYDRWHLGPYPPTLKKVVNNKEYFKRNELFIEVTNDDKLQKYNNPYQDEVSTAISDLSAIFSKYKGAERSHKTELLATVCKVIEDIKSTDLAAVRQSMTEWKIDLKTSTFKNKAEKFNESETEKCIGFIVERGWDRKLI